MGDGCVDKSSNKNLPGCDHSLLWAGSVPERHVRRRLPVFDLPASCHERCQRMGGAHLGNAAHEASRSEAAVEAPGFNPANSGGYFGGPSGPEVFW
jgi:hypothetical protein